MPSPFGGGQLPLTAYFGPRSSQSTGSRRSGRSAEGQTPAKRKDSPGGEKAVARLKKKQKQNENETLNETLTKNRGQRSLADALKAQGSTSRKKDSPPLASVSSVAREIDRDDGDSLRVPPLRQDGAMIPPGEVVCGGPPAGSSAMLLRDRTPTTPTRHYRLHRTLAIASLPSPPLTAPTAKHLRRVRHEQEVPHPESSNAAHQHNAGHREDPSHAGATCAQVVGNKDAIVLRYPHNGGKAAMLPPALPLKAPSSHMPIRPPLQHPRSSSSDKWVPSSQARELSLSPRKDWKRKDASDSLPHTPVDHTGQVVPSSQSNERELQLSDVLPPASDIYKTPASPLHVDGLPLSTLVPLVEDSPDPLEEGDLAAALPSREVVESSQSQYENEISSAWAETLSARQAALSWDRNGEESSAPSSPKRSNESQGYDANDEFSQSQDAQSQPSTFTPSDPITSPFHTPSRRRSQESAESYPVEPYLRTPSQLRAFVHMFDERDDTGNVLLSTTDDGEADSPAASPSPSSRRMTRPDQSEATPERSRGTKRPLRDLTPPCSYAERPPRSRRRGSEEDLDPSQRRADDSDPDLSSGSSSPSLVFPTPVREFFEMYDESQESQVSPS
ncbi:hypothetical protein PYCCODRAFT_1470824 [Trametes coccinea BRFM310]|uniref:Uncharacterized protein n=1 Tax=Trametes coccinea (strain BRFM310) TaxID=1353009 RepID=A0A1Y2IC07_TRAC3|nr:hypothetical protein PYCCODRAFT_1470824 [Trametes coccinea BRFM310]